MWFQFLRDGNCNGATWNLRNFDRPWAPICLLCTDSYLCGFLPDSGQRRSSQTCSYRWFSSSSSQTAPLRHTVFPGRWQKTYLTLWIYMSSLFSWIISLNKTDVADENVEINKWRTHGTEAWSVFLPGQAGDGVQVGDLFGFGFVPRASPRSPVKHSQPAYITCRNVELPSQTRRNRTKIYYYMNIGLCDIIRHYT